MPKTKHFYEMFHPENYNIYLDINREEKIIKGKTTIKGEAMEKIIAFHQKYLTIDSVKIANQEIPFVMDDEHDAFHFNLVQTGDTTITIEYTSPLTDTMMGIYPSYYEVNGEKKQIIGTQFETTAARQAFPGIDEPEAKATFDLAIKFDEKPNETILANMPEIKTENGVHYFDTTKRMSTYLIAFAFGELQGKQTETNSGVKIGVFSTKAHQMKELDFALDIAKRAIEFYEEFYQTPYPLPHSWQLALPDFSAGAMENWGLVTYREAYLLLDPDNASLETKQSIATVITHELAHQWFGDLVTMKWWDDLWLNESFANMMEYLSVDALEPNWNIWELFQTTEVPLALNRDATDGVQPVHVEVENPAEIDALFDSAIVYAKGSRMLVMVRSLIGDDALRNGLKKYFDKHQYGNATGADLWAALGNASGMDVGLIMNTWLEQPGYPVVSVKLEDDDLKISQKQFFIGEGKDVGRQWKIPLNGNYDEVPTIMEDKEIVIDNYNKLRETTGKPFRLNVGNNSHFIVKYDQTLLDDIFDNVDSLDNISQLQLLQDLRLLAEGREISYADVVPLLSKFANSESNIVNDGLYSAANSLKKFVDPDSSEEKQLQKLFDQLSKQQVQRLGWNQKANESNDDQLTRPYVLNASLYAGNSDTEKSAHQMYQDSENNLSGLPADIRYLVLKNEVKNYGSQELFEKLMQEYRQTSDASYKADLRGAITSTPDAKIIAQIIDLFKDASVIKPQDLRGWFSGVLHNPVGEQPAWDWFRKEWDWLDYTVGGDMEFTTYITVIAGVFRTQKRLAEFKEFFEPKIDTPGLTREITMDTRIIESRVDLIADQGEAVNIAIADSTK